MQHRVAVAPTPLSEVVGAHHIVPTGLTWAEVNLDAIAHNTRTIKTHVGPKVEIVAVVKANAYGHGAVPVAHTALENGATRLAVYRLDNPKSHWGEKTS